MKNVGLELHPIQLFVGHFNSLRVRVVVQLGVNYQSLGGPCMPYQFYDCLQARQRLTSPVLRDEREHAVLDFVPLARAGWKVADGDLQLCVVRQLLQGNLPQPTTGTVAAATVCSDQQLLCLREAAAAPPERVPPAL